jgi:hypothetical protein
LSRNSKEIQGRRTEETERQNHKDLDDLLEVSLTVRSIIIKSRSSISISILFPLLCIKERRTILGLIPFLDRATERLLFIYCSVASLHWFLSFLHFKNKKTMGLLNKIHKNDVAETCNKYFSVVGIKARTIWRQEESSNWISTGWLHSTRHFSDIISLSYRRSRRKVLAAFLFLFDASKWKMTRDFLLFIFYILLRIIWWLVGTRVTEFIHDDDCDHYNDSSFVVFFTCRSYVKGHTVRAQLLMQWVQGSYSIQYFISQQDV